MSERDEHDEYLWSKRGPVDPEVEALEKQLARFAHHPMATRTRATRRPRFALAAAALAVIAFGAWFAWRASSSRGGYEVRGVEGTTRLALGDELDAQTDAELEIGTLGRVRVDAGTLVRVDDDGGEAHRLFLERGKIHATILAAPRTFQVGTPAGLSVDLGCQYDLAVDRAGVTTLSVRTGRVAFETEGRKVLVPRGASCHSSPGRGPDTPIFDDAAPEFVEAIRAIEFDVAPDAGEVDRAIELARARDSLSLFHLLDAPSRDLRQRVVDRLAAQHPLPEGATRESVIAGASSERETWRADLADDWR